MTILQTSRLRLVPYRQGDIDSLYAIMRDRRVMQHIGKGPISRDEVCPLVDRVEKRWKDIGMGWWTIRLKKDDRVIGQICLQPLPEQPMLRRTQPSPGYVALKDQNESVRSPKKLRVFNGHSRNLRLTRIPRSPHRNVAVLSRVT
jgi:Acetyltransferase (GNAT) domain